MGDAGTAERGQRLDPCRSAGRRIGRAEMAIVCEHRLRPAQIRRHRRRPAQHRSACCSSLLLVVGGLHDIGGGHQQAVRRHHGWRVAALREATARHRHDAGVRVGRIDLVGGSGPRGRRRRRPAAKLLAARLRRGRARRDFALVRRLLADQAPGGAGFDLGAGLGQLLQSFVAPLQFFRDRHPVRNIRLVRRRGRGTVYGLKNLMASPSSVPRDTSSSQFQPS